MKRTALLTMCLLFVAASATDVFAGGTRMQGMGLSGYEWMIQKDTTLMAYNPAQVNLFPGYVSVTMDNAGNYKGGALIAPTKDVSISVSTADATTGSLYSTAAGANLGYYNFRTGTALVNMAEF